MCRARKVVAALVVAVAALAGCNAEVAAPIPPAVPGSWLGLIAPTAGQLGRLRPNTVGVVIVTAYWDKLESRRHRLDTAALNSLTGRIGEARKLGLRIVLDPGLQYPPPWVFGLPGDTRFVNQYGDAWHGRVSEDVPNAVFNVAVRDAQQSYLGLLADAVRDDVSAIRVGGLLSGELRYPPAGYAAHQGSIWAFDEAAKAAAPEPGWRPGSERGAARSLRYYLDSLTGYERWLVAATRDAFPNAELQVLFPGWGLRPGMTEAAASSGLNGSSNGERNNIIASGSDWVSQVRALVPFAGRTRLTVHCTWVDALAQGPGPTGEPPIAYLARLARPSGLRLSGENTGGGGQKALASSMEQMRRYGLTGLAYMAGYKLSDGSAGLDFASFLAAAARPR